MAGLLTALVTLPYAPVRAVTALARVLAEEADREVHGPAGVRRRLEDLDDALAAGTISADEHERAQQEILDRAVTGTTG